MGRVDLGLSDDEFWSLTPRELSFLVQRHVQRVQLMAAAGLGGLFGSPKSKPISLTDFCDGK